jgi:hypothetical protein
LPPFATSVAQTFDVLQTSPALQAAPVDRHAAPSVPRAMHVKLLSVPRTQLSSLAHVEERLNG